MRHWAISLAVPLGISPAVSMDVDTVTLQNDTPEEISLAVADGRGPPVAAAERRDESWEFRAGPLEIACVAGRPSTPLEIVGEHPRAAAACDRGAEAMV